MKIGGFQKSSLIDYPGKIAAIVFTQGCNFRCGYCHNPELLPLDSDNLIMESDILDFLKTRVGKLDAVVVTGGEPTLQKDLVEFVVKIRGMGFLVKLDTNGSNPLLLAELINKKLIDYIAMDIKGSISKYELISSFNKTDNIIQSIKLIVNSGVGYEFRTTVLKSQLAIEDFDDISKMIKDAEKYYLQKFVPSKLLDSSLLAEDNYSDDEFTEISKKLQKCIKKVEVR